MPSSKYRAPEAQVMYAHGAHLRLKTTYIATVEEITLRHHFGGITFW